MLVLQTFISVLTIGLLVMVRTTRCNGIRRQHETGLGIPIVIDEDNWDILMRGEWILSICAMDRADCKQLELNSNELATSRLACYYNMGIAILDLSKEPFLQRRFWAFKVPLIYHVKYGEFRPIDPKLDVESLCQLVELRKWRAIDPDPDWKHPNSIWTCLSVFGYKAGVDLWKSGAVSDYKLASWAISFMFTGAITLLVWTGYFFWMTLNYFLTMLAEFQNNRGNI